MLWRCKYRKIKKIEYRIYLECHKEIEIKKVKMKIKYDVMRD